MEHIEICDILQLMKAVSDCKLACFELQKGDFKLSMKRKAEMDEQNAFNKDSDRQVMAASENYHVHTDPVILSKADNQILCPLVGTFYTAPSPEAENFVKVGDHVKKGQVLGIVEAMKLMNEIESEYDGVVEAILVKNEEMVEYGQPLFVIR